MSELEDIDWITTQDETPDEYDDLPRYEDMSDERKREIKSLDDNVALYAGLTAGQVPNVGTVLEKDCSGNTKADALGKAYITRDMIQDAGGSCEVRYIEPLYVLNNTVYHRVEIEVTESNE